MSLAEKAAIIGVTIAAIVGTLIIFRSTIVSGFTSAGQTIGTSAGGFLGGIGQGITESFSQFEFPSFEFGTPDVPSGASELAGEIVPFGTEGGTVSIPADTFVDESGVVTSSTPPTATDPQLTAIQQFTLQQKGFFETLAGIFSFGSVDVAIGSAIDEPNISDLAAAEDFAQASRFLIESIENPSIEGDEPIGFFEVFGQDVPLSQAAFDFFISRGVEPQFRFAVPDFPDFNRFGA